MSDFNPMKGVRKRRTSKPAPAPEGGNPLFTTQQAAKYLNVSDDIVENYRKAGLLKSVPLPSASITNTIRKILFRRSDLDDLVNRAIAGKLASSL